MNLDGAVVVVTGASHGIGRATALELASRGAEVVAVGRDAAALAELARETGGLPVVADVADPEHASRVIERALEDRGRIDAVIANAGTGYTGAFADMPTARISALLEVNFRAPMLVARAALPILLAQERGTLAFVTSIAGAVPVPGEAAYCASKTALEAFADALRGELRGTGITISTVRPGVVNTRFHEARTVSYERRWPRPMAAERVARVVVSTLEQDIERRCEPRWLGIPVWLRQFTPSLYRSLSRAFS
jgi:short-subunit dehydrogenase